MKKITVIVPSYNNRQWYERNLSSVASQDYHNFRIIYIDDCSLDETGRLVEEFIQNQNLGNLIRLIRNPIHAGALKNIYSSIHTCGDDEIVVLLDGDDWFAHNRVLNEVNAIYTNPSCWMTYGNYRSWPDNKIGYSKEIPADVVQTNSFREHEWCASHLRTFRAWLFKLIRIDDLLGPSGTFYSMAWDQAIMFPMLEMSGHRAKFISEVLYIYNTINPTSDWKVDRQFQRHLEAVIRKQKRYDRLK